MVALERYFAGTPRGAALINRIKADPALANAEIRVVSHEGDYTRVLSRDTAAASAVRPNSVAAPPTQDSVTTATAFLALDGQGTRRAARYRMASQVEVVVDGNVATLVNLSSGGAQVVSAAILRPNQRVRMTLADDAATVRFSAAVAWAAFEIPPKAGPQYRAGLEFTDADPAAVGAFCDRHKD